MSASLIPRLCPSELLEYVLEVVEVTVLFRLGPKALDAAEKEDAVDATESCLDGYAWGLSV